MFSESLKETGALSPKLKLGEPVPYLELATTRGASINLWDFKQRKNLVLFFHHGVKCGSCVQKLKELDENHDEAQELEAEVLAVSFDTLNEIREYSEKTQIRVPLLSDLDGETTERFTYKNVEGDTPSPSIFVADRFGILRYQKIAEEANMLPDVQEILSWLKLIEIECPECSHL